MALLSLRAYAKHRGCSLSAVQKAIKTGRIQTTAQGKIDPEQADPAWQLATDHSKRRDTLGDNPGDHQAEEVTQGDHQDGDHPESDHQEADHPEPPGQRGSATATAYAKARAVRENYVARIKQLEFEELAGSLVQRAEVEKQIFEITRTVRDAILNIPNRISAELASETDSHKIHVKLTSELTQALEELANGISGRDSDS